MVNYPEKDAFCESTTCTLEGVSIPEIGFFDYLISCKVGFWHAELFTAKCLEFSNICAVGTASIKFLPPGTHAVFRFYDGREFNAETSNSLRFQLRTEYKMTEAKSITVELVDINGIKAEKIAEINMPDVFFLYSVPVGADNAWQWTIAEGFDWTKIKEIRFNYASVFTIFVDDVHFTLKQAYAFLWIRSLPTTGIPFTIDGSPGKTDIYLPQIPGTEITVSAALEHNSYVFDRWEDGSTDHTRTFTIWTDMTITAYYTGPPPACSSYQTLEDCRAANCFWWENSCHSEAAAPPDDGEPAKGKTLFDRAWASFQEFSERIGLPVLPKPPSPPSLPGES